MASASCGRSVLNSWAKSSKRACCCKLFIPGGRVASFFSVRCMRSCNVKILRGLWNEDLFRVLEGIPDLARQCNPKRRPADSGVKAAALRNASFQPKLDFSATLLPDGYLDLIVCAGA